MCPEDVAFIWSIKPFISHTQNLAPSSLPAAAKRLLGVL
jgi:hypothetical protein